MAKKRPYCLSIAGFDPSGGAGLNADLKVFEAFKVTGLSVCSANTIQTEDTFIKVAWTDKSFLLEQLKLLQKTYSIKYCKIGLIENLDILDKVIDQLKKDGAFIIWDPILSASSGYDFGHNLEELKTILEKVNLVTPNWTEFEQLFGHTFNPEITKEHPTHIYLKGGHNQQDIGKDYLLSKDLQSFNSKSGNFTPKHGSGCILSAAICANLSLGYPLKKALLRSKRYVEFTLKSNPTLLAWHKI